MSKSAQKNKSTTQKFIEIRDISDNIVFLANGNACLIIEIQAINFPLLSKEEQNTKALSYATLLNSLSFPIQIFIRSKKIDISSYLKLLDEEINKNQNQLLKSHIKLYRDFVAELVKMNTVLDKKFYIAIPYSGLEGGSAKAKLFSKAEGLHSQLKRMSLTSKTLDKENLVKLFYEIYNGDFEQINETLQGIKFPAVTHQIN
ncbi:MAG: hypothetical protein HY425_01125 [Candidatus Levybacteria bacterium]|nr:hypothetical protein [Candidatus Levybacteria bacterium]